MTDGGLTAALARFPGLRSLQLKSDALTDAGLACLSGLTALERLELVDCESVKGTGMAALLAALPDLQVCPCCLLHLGISQTPIA